MGDRQQLTEWVKTRHGAQLIRRTKEPYFNHLTAVAEMAAPALTLGYEIGLCHDLLEDTGTTQEELKAALLSFGYPNGDADFITICVVELTDVFTADNYPELSKAERKKGEAARLITMSAAAQTVKYADLIYNLNWVLTYDQKHAHKYRKKKLLLLAELDKGNDELRQHAINCFF